MPAYHSPLLKKKTLFDGDLGITNILERLMLNIDKHACSLASLPQRRI